MSKSKFLRPLGYVLILEKRKHNYRPGENAVRNKLIISSFQFLNK
jgi:hypothetical protein